MRDVHNSHYGRICPIETPEGPNIGLLGSLATYGHINEFGFIETPYRAVFKHLHSSSPDLIGRTLWEDLYDSNGKVFAKTGKFLTKRQWEQLQQESEREVQVRPFVTMRPEDIKLMPADDEETHVIAQANIPIDNKGQFIPDKVETRTNALPVIQPIEVLDLMDVSPMQIVSVSTSLIPFLEHDDANRALMGSNMQRQAVPLLKPEAPLVGTGMERRVALDSGQVVLSKTEGVVTGVSGNEVIVRDNDGNDVFLSAGQVPTQQPEHVRQPAPRCDDGPARPRRGPAGGLLVHGPGRSGARPQRTGGIHELGRLQL